MSRDELTALKFVGDATAEALVAADVDHEDVANRRISHEKLLEAGVNPGVAAKIRREHSLSWSFEGGRDLDRRAEQIRGLGDEERAWVAASAGDWEDAETADGASADGSGSASAAEAAWRDRPWPGQAEAGDDTDDATAEISWREASAPTPVRTLEALSDEDATALETAGVTSVRRLATVNVERLADSLDVDVSQVRDWRDAARDHEDDE